MKAHDYPILFFQEMVRLANDLKAINAQILDCQYSYESFGSWVLTFRRAGGNFRIVMDGKDGEMTLQSPRSPENRHTTWGEPCWSQQVPSRSSLDFGQLIAAIERIAR